MTLRKPAFQALCLMVCLAATASPASEHGVTPEMVVEALAGQGYSVDSVTRTMLGRMRFVASQGLIWREVVLDLSSGQILRDYAVEFTPQQAPRTGQPNMPRGGTRIDLAEAESLGQ